ncbi:MAG: hypothetical protein AABW75_02450 [Nanoarchaeota archaeon]
MNQVRERYYRSIFLISSVYDIVLGIIFMFFYGFAFEFLGIPEKLPSFGGYISLIGAFLLVIGVGYYFIYRGDLQRNYDLIKIGALYKFAYCLIVFYYFFFNSIPHIIFVSLFGVIDLIFFVLMLECVAFLKANYRR